MFYPWTHRLLRTFLYMMVYRALMVYRAETLEGEVAALADITVTAHEHTLATFAASVARMTSSVRASSWAPK